MHYILQVFRSCMMNNMNSSLLFTKNVPFPRSSQKCYAFEGFLNIKFWVSDDTEWIIFNGTDVKPDFIRLEICTSAQVIWTTFMVLFLVIFRQFQSPSTPHFARKTNRYIHTVPVHRYINNLLKKNNNKKDIIKNK